MVHAPSGWTKTFGVAPRLVGSLSFQMAQCVCFGEVLPHAWMEDCGWNQQQQCVFEAEIMPYAVSLMLWKRQLTGKCIFVFIDNEGARSSWISGFAATKAAQHMLHLGTSAEAELCVHPFLPGFRPILILEMLHLVGSLM